MVKNSDHFKPPNTPHASEEGNKSKSRMERKVQSDLNSLVKMSAGLHLPEM